MYDVKINISLNNSLGAVLKLREGNFADFLPPPFGNIRFRKILYPPFPR